MSIFGEGLIAQPPTGGLEVQVRPFEGALVDVEGEFSKQFHSEAFQAPNVARPMAPDTISCSSTLANSCSVPVFATGKGGVLRSTNHPEDRSLPSLPGLDEWNSLRRRRHEDW